MFCAHELVFGGTDGVGSRFHVLRGRTHFRPYQGRRVPFSCFALPNSFSAVPRVSVPVFMFCASGLVFGSTKGVGSHLDVLRSRNLFRRYRRRRLPFSCFARPDSFSAAPMASGLVFMFCVPGHVFYANDGVGSCFHVLRAQTRFRPFRGCRVSFSCYARPDTFSAVPRATCPIFMFCAPGLVLGGNEGVESCFHVLRSRTRFRRYRGRWIPF
jgi:hypothetical protein